MNKHIAVQAIVEGRTEQLFVQQILAPYLGTKGISLEAKRIGNANHRGGRVKHNRALTDIRMLLKQRSDTVVTTMFDYYGLQGEWPGRNLTENERRTLSASQKANKIESGLFKSVYKANSGIWNLQDRFIPFFLMHEFEGLLFSEPSVLAGQLNLAEAKVMDIVSECGEPEEINDSIDTAPSKRLDELVVGKYLKTVQGIPIAHAIGVPRIRQACPHFNQWVGKLENLV